jgi:peptide/nickel transport system permease protein
MSAAATQTPNASFVRRLLSRPLAVVALLWLVLLLVLSIGAPVFAPLDPLEQDLLALKQLPSAEHWLGTDALGRDVFSRMVHGVSLTIAGVIEAVVMASLLGLSLGVSAGYFGGLWDRCVQQYVSLVQSLPTMLIMLAVLAVFGQAMLPAMVTLGVMGSAGVSRVLRSVTLAVREELYIAAARISGLSDAHIILRHVLPRIAGPVIVQMSLFAAIAVIVQTGISFLGLGVAPPAPTWGSMIFEASASLNDFPWLLVPSGGVVALTVLSFGLLGDSLRDASTESWSRPAVRQSVKARQAIQPKDLPEGCLLSLRDVTIVTGTGSATRTLVQGVNLDLKQGETLGIVGESGSGKTLTSLSLMGLLPPGVHVSTGTAVINGEVIDLSNEKRLTQLRGATVGMIFQEPMAALDPCFTIGHQLAEVIRLQGLGATQVQAKVMALLEQVKIPNPQDVAKRYPHQISGGMAQRVGIARALASEPRILLADEPTTALDVTVQAEILALLRSLSQSRQMAVVLVTHDWGVVADICDRAMVLRHGQVLESATVVDLFHRPQHPYTQALLAANPHSAKPGDVLPTVDDKLMNITGVAT